MNPHEPTINVNSALRMTTHLKRARSNFYRTGQDALAMNIHRWNDNHRLPQMMTHIEKDPI